jgi:hypothetical protein
MAASGYTGIDDAEAKRIAASFKFVPVDHPLMKFLKTGEIHPRLAVTGERDLRAYVCHHGERGPVDGWEAI